MDSTTQEQAYRRRKSEELLRPHLEAVRQALHGLAMELGGAIGSAAAIGDEVDRQRHVASLVEVGAARRVLFMDGR